MKKNEIKKYWFYLEPYTFIFKGETTAVLYNSLSFKGLKIDYTPKVKSIIQKLSITNNMYVVALADSDLSDCSLQNFIEKVREFFSGDLVSQSLFKHKPAILPPILNLQMSVANLKKDPELFLEQDLSTHLNELTFYITGKCQQSCTHCEMYRKQFSFCHKSRKNLNIADISKMLYQTSSSPLSKINICGGNIFLFPEWINLLDLLQDYNITKVLYCHYLNVNTLLAKQILKQKKTSLNILVNFPIQENKFAYLENEFAEMKDCIKWTFIVSDENEYRFVEELISKFSFDNYLIKPFFMESNREFFNENVLLTESEILNSISTKKEIFAKEVLNMHDYGKLIITEDGKVYANLNQPSLGKINNHLFDLILKEFKLGKSWRKTRLKINSCKKCVYRLLCPSPSGYEYAMGQIALCNLSNEEKGLLVSKS